MTGVLDMGPTIATVLEWNRDTLCHRLEYGCGRTVADVPVVATPEARTCRPGDRVMVAEVDMAAGLTPVILGRVIGRGAR